MTTLTRSSITGLHHPKRSFESLDSSLTNKKNCSSLDRILNADKSSADSSINTSRSCSSLNLSTIDQSILETQLKRANSCNETLEASLKRLRSETENTIEDLTAKNLALERSLHESKVKILELESQLDKSKHSTITADTLVTPSSILEQQIKTLENEKLELKLQLQQNQHLHNKEITQLEKTILDFKRKLVEQENQFKLSEFERDKLANINQNFSARLKEKSEQLDQLQKRNTELELLASKLNPTNVINQSLINDIKQTQDIRFENEQLKKEIELLKLKCNERILHDEELRTLRKQVQISEDYRIIIAKRDAEILKLREQLSTENTNDLL